MEVGECVWPFRLWTERVKDSEHGRISDSKRELLGPKKGCNAYQICIPHADDIPHAHLAHKEAVHPAKGELHVLDPLFL